jgi:hypothetical protein
VSWNLNDYETVETRLARFIEAHPNFRIKTELLENTSQRFIVRTEIWKDASDPNPWSTGLAYEIITDRGVNATSALENCETSSIGRCLANAGFAAKGKRPSREEMAKVVTESPIPSGVQVKNKNNWSVTPQAEPMQLDTSIELVTEVLGAEVVKEEFKCKHGKMAEKGGMTKDGKKPYWGFVCTSKTDTCKPRWARIGADGKWFFPKENPSDYL